MNGECKWERIHVHSTSQFAYVSKCAKSSSSFAYRLGHNFWNGNDREISIRHLADSDVPTYNANGDNGQIIDMISRENITAHDTNNFPIDCVRKSRTHTHNVTKRIRLSYLRGGEGYL